MLAYLELNIVHLVNNNNNMQIKFTSDCQDGPLGHLRHSIGGQAAVVAGMDRVQAGDGQQARVLVDASHFGPGKCDVGQKCDAILPPLDVDGKVTLSHGANGTQAFTACQVLGEGEGLNDRGD